MAASDRRPTALITGASGGIGEELAYSFARGGYDIALVARSRDKLEAVAGRVRALKVEAHVVTLDLEAQGAGERLQAELAGVHIDALVNNAGYGLVGAFAELELAPQVGEVDLNVRVLTELTHRFLQPMLSRGGRGVLNVASTAAFQPGPHMAVYYASKAYVLSFTEALNQELRGTGLNATALCPGPVLTGFQQRAAFDDTMQLTKMLRPMPADVVAEAGYRGFQARRPVVIPGASNAIPARLAGFVPRGVLLNIVEQMQKKREGSHG